MLFKVFNRGKDESLYAGYESLLRSIPLFMGVDSEGLGKIAKSLVSKSIKAGEVLFNKGDYDFALYIVVSGQVKAHDGNHTFATFGPRQFFGEYSMLDSLARSTTITALRDTELLRLDQGQFNLLLDKNPLLSRALLKTLVWRLRDYNVIEAELTAKNQEIKRQKEEMDVQRKELVSLNQTKDKFFAIIAHDLKNPFGAVLSLSELLAREFESFEPEKLHMFIQQIYKYSNNTFNLLENLLQWSLLQTGRTVVNLKSLNMAEIINENIDLLKANALQKGIELAWVNPDDHFVYCDRDMITTVLRNLISNAIKFTPAKGRIEVEVVKDSEYIKVMVRDFGVGISPENQQKLFRIDSNPSTPGTNEEEGTGLGLILCKEFVEKNRGTIAVESTEGKGSTFFFTVPRFENKS